MACLNITSLSKHIDELRVLLQNNSLDLLAINETRLNETIADNEISISGYNIVRRDRPLNGQNGGGVCFYVRSNINYIVRADLVSDQLENLSIEIIKPRSNPLLLQRGIDPQIHLLNYSLRSKTLSESLMRMEKNITSWVISTAICFQRLFITLILRLC